MTKIICIGKKHEVMYEDAIKHFESRLKQFTKLTWLLLPHSSLEGLAARKEESSRIIGSIKQNDFVILLDEAGEIASSPELASLIDRAQCSSQDICIVIGGAYGVDESLLARANVVVAFGRAVFPHQLIRVMITEQLYRAFSILAGSGYHHK